TRRLRTRPLASMPNAISTRTSSPRRPPAGYRGAIFRVAIGSSRGAGVVADVGAAVGGGAGSTVVTVDAASECGGGTTEATTTGSVGSSDVVMVALWSTAVASLSAGG